jgi:hypothetical protein
MRVVCSCPNDCGTDLEDYEEGLWCPECEVLFSRTQLAIDDAPGWEAEDGNG